MKITQIADFLPNIYLHQLLKIAKVANFCQSRLYILSTIYFHKPLKIGKVVTFCQIW